MGVQKKLVAETNQMVNEVIAKLPFELHPVTDEEGANAAVALLLKPTGKTSKLARANVPYAKRTFGLGKWRFQEENVNRKTPI
jgi:hypothetical protein